MTSINGDYLVLAQNNYKNSKTPCAPVFRGGGVTSNSLPAQATQPLTYPPDTVEFSSADKIKEADEKKTNSKMSTGAKIGLTVFGALATAYAYKVGHRMLTKPSLEKMAQNFSEIFRRDVSKEEAQKLVNNYKDIFKEDDVEKFCTNIFEQVKKDYGYGDINIKLKIEKLADTSVASRLSKKEIGSYNAQDGVLTLHPSHYENGMMTSKDKYEILKAVVHEFQHAKQSEISYRTDITKYLNAIQERMGSNGDSLDDVILHLEDVLKSRCELTKFMKEYNIETAEEAKKRAEELMKLAKEKGGAIKNSGPIHINKDEIRQTLDNLWGKFEKFKPDTKDYDLGLRYIDNEANYISGNNANYKEYTSQLLEKEAFGTGPKIKEIYNSFANPWRIF